MINLLESYNAWVLGAGVPLALIVFGGYFAVCLRRIWLHPVRLLGRMLRSGGGAGVSPLRATALSLAGVLGVGNLVGVASALAYGGAGAVLWMWISAALAMMLKYAEVVLAIRHRRLTESGVREGGAMYYIEDGFSGERSRRWGRRLGCLFAALLLLDAVCMGCVLQVNAMATAITARTALSPVLVGGVLGGTVVLLGMRGDGRVRRACETLVPWMTLAFCVLSLIAIGRRADALGSVLGCIVRQGLLLDGGDGRGILCGIGAFLFSRGLRFGTARGLLSNEAGCGTSPMAHADADTEDAVAQGGMGMLEVFVDTHLLCTMTALVILLAYFGEPLPALSPMLLTIEAFERLLWQGAGWFLCGAVFCFGLATLLCWSHYMLRAGAYLFPSRSAGKGSFARRRDALLLMFYAAFAVIGAVRAPAVFWQLADFAIGSMTLINVAVLFRFREQIVSVSVAKGKNGAKRNLKL